MTAITIPRALLEQALEALEYENSWHKPRNEKPYVSTLDAITALRAALAQEQAEPGKEPVTVDCCANCLRPKGEHQGDMCPRPYTTVWSAWDYKFPPPQRTPLTEEEIERIRADEREACATRLEAIGCDHCAANIRARSKA